MSALLQKISSPDFVYAGVFITFVVLVSILFIFSANFIIKSVNTIFVSPNDNFIKSLDSSAYEQVAKRLGIETHSVATPLNSAPVQATSATRTVTQSSLSITIRNSTGIKGSAGALSKSLEAAGFAKATTGNEKKRYATTTIFIDTIALPYAETIKNVVKKTYQGAVIGTASSTAGAADITIIIGTQ